MRFCPVLLGEEEKEKEKGTEKKKIAVFPEMSCVYGLMYFFKPASKEVGRINQLCFVRSAGEIGST